MRGTSALQRILDPVSVDEFVAKYFQRYPLWQKGPSSKFDYLFREDDFPVNLNRVKHIRAVFPHGNKQATIRPTDVPDMFDAGATICITGMELAHPKLLQTARLVRAELNYAGDVSFRAYYSPPGSGFDLHFDARVTTTLQIAGKKRWWFASEPAVAFPKHNSGRGSEHPAGRVYPKPGALRSVVLRPGHVLCLPAGVWHCAEAVDGNRSLALNLALDHKGGGVFDSIVNTLHDRLTIDPAWREPLPVAPGCNGRGIPKHVARILRERIDAMQAELSALRDNDAALTRAWRMAVRSEVRK